MLDSPDTIARSRLRSGEQLLWAGRPDPSRLFNASDVFLIPFGLFFTGFSIFWTVSASRSPAPFVALFGIVFVAVGVYYVFGRFVVKRSRLARSTYAVTNRRAFAVIGRTLIETPVGAQRTITASGDDHVTVLWSDRPGIRSLTRNQVPANSGLDGILSPLPMGFFGVPESAALLAALDRAETATLT